MQDNNEFNDFGLDNAGEYKLPDQKEIVVDLAQNKVLDTKNFSPIQMIYLTAKEKGIKLKEFPPKYSKFDKEKKNPYPFDTGCRKTGCMGRGYKGWIGSTPIPCECLFTDEQMKSDGVSVNRNTIRNYHKIMQKEAQEFKQNRMKELGLNPLGNGIYGKIKKGTKTLIKYEWQQIPNKQKWDFVRIDLPNSKKNEELEIIEG